MELQPTPFQGAFLAVPNPFQDDRGWFIRTYDKTLFAKIGLSAEWVQMNQSMTRRTGAIRGMHFQYPPYAEIKLVRCIAGCVFDVIIDLRQDSSTFLQWFGVELSAVNRTAIYIPKGFAHGFQTLTSECELIYCHSEFYTPESEGSIRFDDPRINIEWPLPVSDLSERDATHPLLSDHFSGLTI